MGITIVRDGLRLTGPTDFKRDAYVRVSVEVLDDQGRNVMDAWADAVSLAYEAYGTVATEDNTVGQLAQCKPGPVIGRRFSLGLNLYGRKVRDLKTRLAMMG